MQLHSDHTRFEVNFQNGLTCGGAYIKLLTSAEDLDTVKGCLALDSLSCLLLCACVICSSRTVLLIPSCSDQTGVGSTPRSTSY